MGQLSNGMFDGLGLSGVAPGAGFDGILRLASAPSTGTDEVQTLTIGGTPTGGTFRLSFEGQITAAITWSATNVTLLANIQTALDALTALGTNGCVATAGTLTAGIGTITLTFGALRTRQAVPTIAVYDNSLTGTSPTLAVAETTPGVDASFRGWPKGIIVASDVSGTVILYQNTGTSTVPVWTHVGAQT